MSLQARSDAVKSVGPLSIGVSLNTRLVLQRHVLGHDFPDLLMHLPPQPIPVYAIAS